MVATPKNRSRSARSGVRAASPLAYHRGRYVAAEKLTVKALDRGFLFGDGVFETLRTYQRKPFRLQSHLARLGRSAAALRIPLPEPEDALARIVQRGIDRVPGGEVSVRLVVTRGQSALSYRMPEVAAPELYAFFSPLPEPAPELRSTGVRVITLVEEKPARFTSVKLMNGVPSILALDDARAQGAYEVLRVSRDGVLLEGFMSNVFAIFGRALATSPVSAGLLDGVTRTEVLELAAQRGLVVDESPLPRAQALRADELFLTHTSVGIVPVVAVDGRPIGNGRPGPVTLDLAEALVSIATNADGLAGDLSVEGGAAGFRPASSGDSYRG